MPIQTTQHRLSEINPEARTATCAVCGPVKIRSKGRTQLGAIRYRCTGYDPAKMHRIGTDPLCERCGFEAEDISQIDGHRTLLAVENLCANCHRLVTKRERELGRSLSWRDL